MDTKSRQTLGMVVKTIEGYGQEAPLFKNSKGYNSKDWTEWHDCSVYPIQRKLTKNECFFDLDKVHVDLVEPILKWLDIIEFKYSAYQTSRDGDICGLHIHFFTPVETKYGKIALVQILGHKIKELFNIENDIQPMKSGVTRTEYSMKGNKLNKMKILIRAKIDNVFPINELSPEMSKKVFDLASSLAQTRAPNVSTKGKKMRTCVRRILEGTFTDCRKRLMFCVASHYVSQKDLSKEEAIKLTWEWAKRQGGIEYKDVVASVNSSQGRVGCNLRHALLEEVGQPIYNCKWE